MRHLAPRLVARCCLVLSVVVASAACTSTQPSASAQSSAGGSSSISAACPTVDSASFVQPGVLTVAVTGSAPPLDQADTAGNPVGMFIDLVNLWAKDLQIPKVQFDRIEFAATLPGLTAGKFDMGGAGVNQTAARLASTDFKLSKPFIASGSSLLLKNDSPVQGWSDMSDKILGGARQEAEFLAAKAKAVPKSTLEFPSTTEAEVALANGQVDAVGMDASEAQLYIKTAPNGSDFRVLADIIDPIAKGTVFRTQNTALIDAVNCEIGKELSDGTIDRLATQWYGSTGVVDTLRKIQNP